MRHSLSAHLWFLNSLLLPALIVRTQCRHHPAESSLLEGPQDQQQLLGDRGTCLLQSARSAAAVAGQIEQGLDDTSQGSRSSAPSRAVLESHALAPAEGVVGTGADGTRPSRGRHQKSDCHHRLSPYQYWPWPIMDYDPCLSLIAVGEDAPEVVSKGVNSTWYWHNEDGNSTWSWKEMPGYSLVIHMHKKFASFKHMMADHLVTGQRKAKSVMPRKNIKPLNVRGIAFLCVIFYPVLLLTILTVLAGCVAICARRRLRGAQEGVLPVEVQRTFAEQIAAINGSRHATSQTSSSRGRGLHRSARGAEQDALHDSLHAPDAWRNSFSLGQAVQSSPLMSCRVDYRDTTWPDSIWAKLCSAVPFLILVGSVGGVTWSMWSCSREAFIVVMVLTSMFLLSTSTYMVSFAHFLLRDLRRNISKDAGEFRGVFGEDHQKTDDVIHWVVLPNYNEDLAVLLGALQSIGASSIAQTQICILLAMEERERDARSKAEQLMVAFDASFKFIEACHHPCGLPNDPPGKASNNAWAFQEVVRLVDERHQDPDKVLVTIADADSWFHPAHFEHLSCSFLQTEPQQRQYVVWQPPIFHMRNYHRQPPPVIVSTLITSLAEGSILSDPNGVRFPYSTYSVPFQLAVAVGGWDPQWIAEDWHMGIKCYMYTYGRAEVRQLMMPVVNYTPEGTTWIETLRARWSQAKRHALGFSDVAYVLMVLPLLLQSLLLRDRRDCQDRFADLCSLLFACAKIITRLVNTHALVAVLPIYMVTPPFLRYMSPKTEQHVLDDMAISLSWGTTIVSGVFMVIYARTFQGIYKTLKDHIEPPSGRWWSSIFTKDLPETSQDLLHILYLILCLCFIGPCYFPAIGVATWLAAWKCATSKHFDYEVAMKPQPAQHLPGPQSLANHLRKDG